MNQRFKKGDIIRTSATHPCIVLGESSGSDPKWVVYDIFVVDPTFSAGIKCLYCRWDMDEDIFHPKKVGEIHPEFVDLFLGELNGS